MALGQQRIRYGKRRNFARAAARVGFTGTSVPVGYQANPVQSNFMVWLQAEFARIAPASDDEENLHDVLFNMRPKTITQPAGHAAVHRDTIAAEADQYTSVDVEAASIPGDIGLT